MGQVDYRIDAARLDIDTSGSGVVYQLVEHWPSKGDVAVWSWAPAIDGPLPPEELIYRVRQSTGRLIGVDLAGEEPRARPLITPIYTDERATKNPFRPYDMEVECPDLLD